MHINDDMASPSIEYVPRQGEGIWFNEDERQAPPSIGLISLDLDAFSVFESCITE